MFQMKPQDEFSELKKNEYVHTLLYFTCHFPGTLLRKSIDSSQPRQAHKCVRGSVICVYPGLERSCKGTAADNIHRSVAGVSHLSVRTALKKVQRGFFEMCHWNVLKQTEGM